MEPNTDAMKHALAEALLQLLRVKPLEQITVQELANACYIRRQTFYYHFADIYALVDWILQQGRASFSDSWDAYLSWQDYLTALLTHLDSQRERYRPLIGALGFPYVFRLFQGDVEGFLRHLIAYYAPPSTSEQEGDFLLFFCTKMMFALLEGFLRQDFPYTPQALVGHLDTMTRDFIRGATLRHME